MPVSQNTLGCAISLVILLAAAANSSAQVVVTSSSDSGAPGTLRAAINTINAEPGGGTISFNIPGGCPAVITLNSPLPGIIHDSRVYGYTQRGSSQNTLEFGDNASICVVLEGFTNAVSDGITVPASAEGSVSVNVTDMAFSGFTHAAIDLRGGSNHGVSGVHIGGGVNGYSLHPVQYGIVIGPGVSGVTIGGDPSDYSLRNIIGDAMANSIYIDSASASTGAAHDNEIADNYIGLGWSSAIDGSVTDRGDTGSGIAVGGYHNLLLQNIISYNGAAGVHISNSDAHDNTLDGNEIGSSSLGSSGNGGAGVPIDDDASDNTLQNNSIFGNSGAGIRVVNGQGNLLFRNNIFGNGDLGIDIAGAGVTPNDDDGASQPPDYANRGQNFPVLTNAAGGHFSGTISGTLTTTPGLYLIAIYSSDTCDASGFGQGENLLTLVQVEVNDSGTTQGTANFDAGVSGDFLFGNAFITATATDEAGSNTSEFSACISYLDDTIFANDFEPPLL